MLTEKRLSKIVLVDDEPSVLSSLRRQLRRDDWIIEVFTDPDAAIESIRAERPDLVISDQRMPKKNGTQFLSEVYKLSPSTERFLLTGYSDIEATIGAINEGRVSRMLSKPWNESVLVEAISESIAKSKLAEENQRLTELIKIQNSELQNLNQSLEQKVILRTHEIQTLNSRLEKSFLESLKLIGSVSEMSRPQLAGHSRRVALLAGEIARTLGLDSKQCFAVQSAAYLHDIGRIGLGKDDERLHCERSAVIISGIQELKESIPIILAHHEKWDGSGYPNGLKGDQIPIGARILSAADHYDKLVHRSQNFEPSARTHAIDRMSNQLFGAFDPAVLNALNQVDTHLRGLKDENSEVAISIYELRDGMILSRALRSSSGTLALGADFKVDRILLERLWKRHLSDPFTESIHIYERSKPRLNPKKAA